LNWRYFHRPNSPYLACSISRNGQWKGYVVIRTFQKWGLHLGTVVDLFFDCAEAAELLLRQAETQLRAEGAEALWGLFSFPSYQKLLRDAGFFRVPHFKGIRQFHFVADFVSVDHLRPDLAQRDNILLKQGDYWFFSLGDTDLA
jgi:hypothetical protein